VSRIRALLLASIVLGLAAQPARADEEEYAREGSYLGLGGIFALEDADPSDSWSGTDDTGGLAFVIGYRMVPQMSWELGGSWLHEFTNDVTGDEAVGTITLAVKLYLAEILEMPLLGGRLQPYAIGRGGMMVGTVGSDGEIGGTYSGGLGVEYYVNPNWAIDTNVQYNGSQGAYDGLDFVGFTLGAIYRF
jgi:opacity protein-like surface antigen